MAEIKKGKAGVSFFENGDEIYFIAMERLPETYSGNISAWVSHLNEKIWMSNQNFYEVARIIRDEFPDNNIDWKNTFFSIEKKDYLEKLIQLKRIAEGKEGEVDFMDYVELGREENNKEINDEIAKIINQKLVENDLI